MLSQANVWEADRIYHQEFDEKQQTIGNCGRIVRVAHIKIMRNSRTSEYLLETRCVSPLSNVVWMLYNIWGRGAGAVVWPSRTKRNTVDIIITTIE
jgi:hypothetical protein